MFQHSENFQGNSVFQGKRKVAQKSWLVKYIFNTVKNFTENSVFQGNVNNFLIQCIQPVKANTVVFWPGADPVRKFRGGDFRNIWQWSLSRQSGVFPNCKKSWWKRLLSQVSGGDDSSNRPPPWIRSWSCQGEQTCQEPGADIGGTGEFSPHQT